MVLEEGSYGQTDILHEVQVTYQKKQSRDTLRIRDSQTASKEELFPLCFMNQRYSCFLIKPGVQICSCIAKIMCHLFCFDRRKQMIGNILCAHAVKPASSNCRLMKFRNFFRKIKHHILHHMFRTGNIFEQFDFLQQS